MGVERVMGPMDIELRSMEIIAEGFGDRTWDEPELSVVKRCIHTSGDFDYAENIRFSPNAADIGVKAIRDGVTIVTDTRMAAAGMNKRALESRGVNVRCYIGDPDVAEEAKSRGCTRSTVSMERAATEHPNAIFAIGNAPTALIALHRLIEEGRVRPSLLIGVPVGFVNVIESKELIMTTDVPYIVAAGRKGGSNIAAAIVNALSYHEFDRD